MRRFFLILGSAALSAWAGCAANPARPAAAAATQPSEVPDPRARQRLDDLLAAVRLPQPASRPARDVPAAALKHYLAGRSLYHRWLNADAAEELEKALRYDPKGFETHKLLGQVYYRLGNSGSAISHLKTAVQINPDDVTCQATLGELYRKVAQVDAARRHLSLALRCQGAGPGDPDAVAAAYELAGVLAGQGHLQAAVDAYRLFERWYPTVSIDDPQETAKMQARRRRTPRQVGELYRRLGQPRKAADALRRAVALALDDVDLKIRYAEALRAAGDRTEALGVARELLVGYPQLAAPLELLERVLADPDRPEAVIRELGDLWQQRPEITELASRLADRLAAAGRVPEAIQVLREAIVDRELPPRVAGRLWRQIARLHRGAGQLPDMIDALAASVAVDQGSYPDAAAVMERLLADPDTAATIAGMALGDAEDERRFARAYLSGLAAERAGRWDQAEQLHRQAVRAAPDFAAAYLALGDVLARSYRWNEVTAVAEAALDAGHELAGVHRMLAEAYDATDQVTRAENHYLRAFALNRRDPRTRLALARLYERTDRRRKAQAQYIQLLNDDPRNDEARDRLVRLFLYAGEVQAGARQIAELARLGGADRLVRRLEALLKLLRGGPRSEYDETLAELVAQQPEDTACRYDLAMSLFQQKDYESAIDQVRAILAVDPAHVEARELLAQSLWKCLDFAHADRELGRLLDRFPRREYYLALRAELDLDRQDFARAAATLEALLGREDLRFSRTTYRMMLVGAQVAQRRYDPAIAALKEWLSGELSDEDRLRLRSRLQLVLHDAERDAEALALAEQWAGLADDPAGTDAAAVLSMKVRALRWLKRYDEAEALLRQQLGKGRADQTTLLEIFSLLLEADRVDRAVALLDEHKDDLEDVDLNVLRGHAFIRAKRYDDAIATFEKMARGPRPDHRARMLVLETLLAAERWARAETVGTELLDETTGKESRLDLLQQVARAKHELEKPDQRDALLREAADLAPRDASVSNNVGYMWADAGVNLQRAETMIRFAVGQEPRNSAYLDSLGWVRYKRGDFAEAVRWLERSTRGDRPEDPIVLDHLGDAYWRNGQRREARAAWTRARDILAERTERVEERQVFESVKRKLRQVTSGQPPDLAPVVGP